MRTKEEIIREEILDSFAKELCLVFTGKVTKKQVRNVVKVVKDIVLKRVRLVK